MTKEQIYVANRIYQESRDIVNFDLGPRSVIKFGRNPDLLTTIATVQAAGGNEVFQTDNTIDTVSSDNVGDNQLVSLQGHTIDANGDFTEVIQEVTLNGQTKVVLGTPLARLQRAFNKGTTDFAGDVFFYQDGTITLGEPDNLADVHLKLLAGQNQSLKAALTVPKDEWLVIDSLVGSISGAAGSVIFQLEVREKGSVFRGVYTLSIQFSTGASQIILPQPAIIAPNSDVRIRGLASATGISAEGIVTASYAKIIS